MFGAAFLTYAVGLWIVTCNPYFCHLIDHEPLSWSKNFPLAAHMPLALFTFVVGSTPVACLTHMAIAGLIVQGLKLNEMDTEDLTLETYRPYVFWRALYRFFRSVQPFLQSRDVDAPPQSSLTEYERVTCRYYLAKIIFLPFMVGIFYGNLQGVLNQIAGYYTTPHVTALWVHELYIMYYSFIMMFDVGWFAVGSSMETEISPIRTVDPYASGWLVALLCYPPLVLLSGQYIVWGSPEFPELTNPTSAIIYAAIGAFLFSFYVVADVCYGLKTGNLLYRGLVDKGPYKIIRHPMYASKTMVWSIFTIPSMAIHYAPISWTVGTAHIIIPMITGHFMVIGPMIGWLAIYALRGITEERYLLRFPEYQEYCKRVRYRFIPGIL